MQDYFEQQQQYLQSKKGLIQKTLSIGEFKNPKPPKNILEAATLMKTCLLIYNLEETITKS